MTAKRPPWVMQPAIPAAAICALAFGAATLDPRGTDWTAFGAALAAAVAVTAAAALVPWPRLPSSALVLVPIGCELVIGLLRQAQGGSSSGYGPLAVLPVVWVGLLLGRHAVAAITACTLLLFAVPIVVVGPPLYPDSGWRGVALWSVVAAVIGLGANRIMVAQRQLTATADARVQQLDRLVATQTVIATSSFDLDAVLAAVVTEAQGLTGADAAVVELPDGDELVYRAVAGTAEPFVGLRLARDSALSGLALQRQTILVCRDSEHDPRVDRDAARMVGARSMIVVPLLHAGSAMGVLKVYSDHADAFSEEDSKVLSLLATMIGAALARAELVARLSEQAVTDELTGLANRRAWSYQLALAVARCRRSGQPLSVILLDLDGFKQVNDRDGHAAGDRVLRAIADAWLVVLRGTDILGRLGGDEFAVMLEGADASVAAEVVDRLERALPSGQTASAGVATWNHAEDEASLLARADVEMYERKRAGVLRAAGAELLGMPHAG